MGVLLFVYSLGLGVPFLLVGLGVSRFMGALDWVRRNYQWIAGVSGGVLIVVGLLLATGEFTRCSRRCRSAGILDEPVAGHGRVGGRP